MDAVMTELQELEELYCEMHKDVYGVKARWYRAESVEQARKDLDALQEALRQEMAREAKAQDAAAAEVEQVIANMIEFGAADRETAIRWLHDSNDTGGDDAYLEFHLGLKYGYFSGK